MFYYLLPLAMCRGDWLGGHYYVHGSRAVQVTEIYPGENLYNLHLFYCH